LEFCVKTIGQSLFGPTANWPNRPTRARLSRPGSDLGRSTDPAQPHSLSSLSPLDHSSDLDRRRHRLPSPANSGGPCYHHLGQGALLRALYQLHQAESPAAFSPGRSGWSSLSGSADSELFDAVPRCWSFLSWWAFSSAWALRASLVEVLRCGAPGATRWSPPSAAPGRPRGHCLAMPARYAPGRPVSDPPLLSLPSLTGHDFWPFGQDQWA
jgi:hypothetical protein